MKHRLHHALEHAKRMEVLSDTQLNQVYDQVVQLNAATLPMELTPDQTALLHRAFTAATEHLATTAMMASDAERQHVISALTTTTTQRDPRQYYTMGKVIGKGTFGRVFMAKHKLNDEKVAIKAYYRHAGSSTCCLPTSVNRKPNQKTENNTTSDALDWKRVRHEVQLMASLRPHPSIIQFLEAFESSTQLHVVMEYVAGTTLCEYLKQFPHQKLPEPQARGIFQHLCSAIASLHVQNVIHRDLKLENILIDASGRPKVIDFGFSQHEASHKTTTKTFCGTPSYMAPEVVSLKSYDGKAVDVWSLGVLLFVMLTGRFPFHGSSFHQLYHNIRHGVLSMPLSNLSKPAQRLLMGIFVTDPRKRLDLVGIQSHPWFMGTSSSIAHSPGLGLPEPLLLLQSMWDWDQGKLLLAKHLASVYGLEMPLVMEINRKKKPLHRLTALWSLCMLTVAKYLDLLITERQNYRDNEAPPPTPEPSISISNQAEDTSSTHKLQLEKLIALVKQSLD